MLSYTSQVCLTFIPTRHKSKNSQEDSLHKAFIACPMFRGMDIATLKQLFKDNLQEMYDKLFEIDADALAVPEDYYSSIAEATDSAGDNHNIEMEPQLLLYLMESYKIVKIGGINNPFACMEWPMIQIPQAILSLLGTKVIIYHFLDDKGAWGESLIHFYERNLVGRGLDFDDAPETPKTPKGQKSW